MRTTTVVGVIAAWLAGILSLQTQQAEAVPSNSSARQTSWVQSLDIDQLDPNKSGNLQKIYLMLRSEDVPRARRLEYARRYLRGEYKYAKPASSEVIEHKYYCISSVALTVLGKLNDIESIPLIEEKLKQWESEIGKPSHERTMVSFDAVRARAVLARLKAVRDLPTVKNADDLVRRLERTLHHIGFEGSIKDFLRALEQEVKAVEGVVDANWPGIYEEILNQYGQMLLEAGWNGIEVEPASKIIQLDLGERPARPVKEVFEVYVQLARIPREQVAQWIVEDALRWQRIGVREECYMQVLADRGVAVLPLVWSRLEWAARHRDQVPGTGMGLVALLRVLVTIGGEQALSLVEPFTNDENRWVRYYACQAKEYIQQGKVFDFGGGVTF